MGSLSPLKLPIIHISDKNLKSGATNRDIWNALEEYGCFEAVHDDDVVNLEHHNAMLGLVENLFELPMETKCKNTSHKPYHGYLNIPQNPLYEGMGIEDATSYEATQRFTGLMWPQGKSNSSEIFLSYAKKVCELENMVTKMVLENLGVEKYYESHVESMSYDIRFMKYKAPMTDETTLGALSHTDKGFFTVIKQMNHVNGLEVQTKGGEWIKVTPSPSSFIFMIGQLFYAWSNGRVHCPMHRIMMAGYETRYSIGVFSYTKHLVQCPKELVDEDHPLLFKPFHHHDLLRFQTKEGGASEAALKTFSVV